jgi:DNA helicase-2/ATP-dependent DNA helicase PcrA
VPVDAREDWQDLAYTLQDVAAAVGNRTPKEIVNIAIEGWYSSYIRNLYSNWSDRIDDLESLAGFAHRFDDMTELLSQLVLLNSEISDRNIDQDFDALRLTTVHQAKGLEFSIVFVIGLAEGLFPNKRAMDEDNLDEERRLFYVAITRAKDELYLSYPMINEHGGPSMRLNPSRFLDEIDREHYEILRVHETTDW